MATYVRASLIIFLCVCGFTKQDDDLLEAISQLELFVKDVRREMFEVRNEIESKLHDLKRKEIDFLQYYFGLKKQSPKKIERAVEESEKKVENLILDLKHNRRDLRLKVNQLEIINNRGLGNELSLAGSRYVPDVSFRASVPEKTRFRGVEKIIFSKPLENTGHGYDNETGIFTAPFTGTYLFTFHICQGGNYIDLAIMKITHVLSWARFFPYYFSCHNLDLITTMEPGDKVYVQHISSWDYSVIYDRNELSTLFSGVLIS
ncbi:uncharacterized protein LOC123545400 [Mercenaria mercenaria]|uniref:uncharacterized protein LOC123545400 n=1 Tax=Mercenaria mercenaria TaxID=6596 RepID=UPI00234F3B84|nr:uncharacterized protein LOC123545400 [Mercenaria mercenaria]